jgi:uncharacterized membrane protein
MANPRSTAAIAGHPIHPMLIPFPIAFFVTAFVCDIVYWATANTEWATVAIWLIGAGVIMAALAAIAGLTDVLGDRRIRALNDVWWHAGGNVLVVLIQIYNWYARYSEGTDAVVPKGLILSLVVVCILLFTLASALPTRCLQAARRLRNPPATPLRGTRKPLLPKYLR